MTLSAKFDRLNHWFSLFEDYPGDLDLMIRDLSLLGYLMFTSGYE